MRGDTIHLPGRGLSLLSAARKVALRRLELLYSVVLTLIRKHGWWFGAVALAAVLLRLFFIWKMAVVTDDSLFYGDIASNLIHHNGYGTQQSWGWQPTVSRLPGYPLFLAFSFLLGGDNHYRAAMLLQLVFDLLSCLLVADIARRVLGERAARTAFVLAAFCPFLMSYVAAPLTECLEIFCTAAAVDCALVALTRRSPRWWIGCGISCAWAILLRPDGGLLLGSIGLAMAALGWREKSRRRELLTAVVLLGAVSLAPLVPWTIRNWRVFHLFQPLVARSATDPGEYVATGWGGWTTTWLLDYANTEDVGFPVPGQAVDPNDIPSWAYNSAAQRAQAEKLLAQYNNTNYQMTPELDRQFAVLAAENIRLHPVRYHLLLPAGRMLDMWLRPRTELMPVDTHFWKFKQDPHDSLCALALAALNLAYVAAAVAGAWVMRRRVKYLGLLLAYPVVRSLFLATIGASEDRYTMECFPFVFVLAAGFLTWWQSPGVTVGDGGPDTARPELTPQP
jgi:4-amino-4-deoxy-L-arabinose transferase-like glycosyltransferase